MSVSWPNAIHVEKHYENTPFPGTIPNITSLCSGFSHSVPGSPPKVEFMRYRCATFFTLDAIALSLHHLFVHKIICSALLMSLKSTTQVLSQLQQAALQPVILSTKSKFQADKKMNLTEKVKSTKEPRAHAKTAPAEDDPFVSLKWLVENRDF